MIVPPEKVEDSAIPLQTAELLDTNSSTSQNMGGKHATAPGTDSQMAGPSGLQTTDPPPAYGDRGQPAISAPPTTHTKFPSSKPTNFLHLTAERNWIKGHFTINPFLTLPPALLAPLAPDESTEADRRNLRLAARMGHIDAEITLVGPQRDEQRAAAAAGLMKRRTRMDVSCDHGMANLAIRTPTPTHPYTLHITLKNASSTIRIPTTFTGLITITAERSWVKLGASLSAHSAPISQVGATNRWFVGDDIAALCEGDWLGDVIEIDGSHSRVKVKYVDKVPGGETGAAVGATKAKGFWSRFAGKS